MTKDSKMQRDIVDATSREITKLNGERVQAERDVAIASTVERARAEVKLGQLKSALADAHSRLQGQVGAIVQDADNQIAALAAQAKTASGPATQQLQAAAAQLKQRRDALATKAASLKQTAAGDWANTKTELDVSLDELRTLRENQAAGIN
jgi:energy-coupling factor transporter ATP-binding protein EcfA2